MSHSFAGTVEAGERQELRKVWLTSMRLLGFDSAHEEKVKVALGRDMFAHINKKGSEIVLHFLFSRLDSHMAYEEFRDCWPIFDKKQETQFRRACSNWLAKISKEDPSSRLPRLASSLLLSPGGDKFYHFLLRFSSFVLKKVCVREAKEEKNVFLSSFVASPEGHAPALKDVSVLAMQAHAVRHTQNVVKRTLLVTKLHEEWRTYTSELVEKYRSYSKEIQRLKKKLEVLEEERKQQIQALGLTGTPRKLQGAGSKASEKVLSLSAEVAAQKRHSRMEKVRAMWRALDGFHDKSSHQREVVNSVLHEQADEHAIDGKDIVFQVPDLLLDDYECLSREGKIANTYEAGQLNIISLVQLWNCSLKVLRDKLLEKELPSLEAELRYVTEALQTQRANLATTKNLRVSLVELRSSVETTTAELEEKLQSLRGKTLFQGGGGGGEGAPVLRIPPVIVPSLGFDLMPPSPKKPLPILASGGDHAEKEHPLPVNLSLRTDEVSTPEAVHNISRSIHHASRHQQHHHSQQEQLTSKLRAPQQVKPLGKSGGNASLLSTPQTTGDLSMFLNDDESPGRTVGSTLTSTRTPASASSTSTSRNDHQLLRSSTKNRGAVSSGRGVVKESSKVVKKPRSLKPKVLKSSSKEPPPKSPLTTTSVSVSSPLLKTPRERPRAHESAIKKPHSSLAVHKMTEAASGPGRGRGKVGGARPQEAEDKENTSPLPVAVPKAHDILAEQIAAAVANGDGLEHVDESATTPEGWQIHSFMDPISAMGTDAFVVRDKIPRTPTSKSVKQTQGSANSSVVLQSPSLKSASLETSTSLHTPQIPSPLATNLSAKLNLPSLSPFSLNTTIQQGTLHSVATSQSLEKSNLINFSLSPLQDSKLDLQQKGEESVLGVSSTSNKSSPPPRLPQNQNDASSGLEQPIEAPPTTSQHASLDGSHSIADEKGLGEEDEGIEGGDENNTSGQIAEESPPPKSTSGHSLITSDGSTTPEPSPILSQQPTSEELGLSQHAHINTPSTSAKSSHTGDTTPSLQSSTSAASSSRKVAFRMEEGVSPSFASAQPQLGLFSPGSLQQQQQLQAGLSSFQTPPASSSSYQLMSELPPTPFQEANFDLDDSSSSESEEHEGEERDQQQQQEFSRESGDSFDSSYFSRLQKKVVPLISQEDIEASSLDHELDGVISRADMEEREEKGEGPQPKLVDIDQSPSSYPTHLQPPVSHHHLHGSMLDSANSLKVVDLLGLDSPAASNHMVLQQSPLLKAYQSPQVGLLVDIRTPGSNLSGKPLLTSTVQGQPVSATASREQRGHVPSPTSDILLPYLPSHSGTQSATGGLLTSASVDSQRTWSSLMTTNSGSPFLVSPATNTSKSAAEKSS